MRALVRPPGPRLAEGLVTHIERRAVNPDLALEQWAAYVETLLGNGWQTVEVPGMDDCPDAVFIEDTVVMYAGIAVITLPGADSRRAETAAAEQALALLGYPVRHIEAPGTLDGGDVLKVGSTVYVGQGGRSNAEGLRQLAVLLEPAGATVVGIPVTKALHLKSAVTALPDGTVVGYPPLVDDPDRFERFLGVPEESGSHVVLLGEDRLLMAADCPRSVALYRDLGYSPVEVDISEFQKLEGCVTCLSVRLRNAPAPSWEPATS